MADIVRYTREELEYLRVQAEYKLNMIRQWPTETQLEDEITVLNWMIGDDPPDS